MTWRGRSASPKEVPVNTSLIPGDTVTSCSGFNGLQVGPNVKRTTWFILWHSGAAVFSEQVEPEQNQAGLSMVNLIHDETHVAAQRKRKTETF